MKPTIFRRQPFRNQSLNSFIDMVHSSQMNYWASDLLSKGLKPGEIREAVSRAMLSCRRNGLEMNRHFQPIYTSSNQGVSFDNCKMSLLGYRLTILNANPGNTYVAAFQLRMLEK